MSRRIDPERLEECACLHVRKAARAITRAYDGALAPAALEATQFTVLASLAGDETLTMTELAQRLVMDRTTLSRNVRPLIRAGYVRVRFHGDRRRRFLELSPGGRRKLRLAFPLWRAAQRRAIEAIGRSRFVNLIEHLEAATVLAENV